MRTHKQCIVWLFETGLKKSSKPKALHANFLCIFHGNSGVVMVHYLPQIFLHSKAFTLSPKDKTNLFLFSQNFNFYKLPKKCMQRMYNSSWLWVIWFIHEKCCGRIQSQLQAPMAFSFHDSV